MNPFNTHQHQSPEYGHEASFAPVDDSKLGETVRNDRRNIVRTDTDFGIAVTDSVLAAMENNITNAAVTRALEDQIEASRRPNVRIAPAITTEPVPAESESDKAQGTWIHEGLDELSRARQGVDDALREAA